MTFKNGNSQDSNEQKRQAEENEKRRDSGIPVDKKLDGPNRPSV